MINRRYAILKKIGEGRSSVFLCNDKYFGKDIAIKILPSDAEKSEVASFKDEYLSLKKISHPNILTVYDYGTVLKLDSKDNARASFSGSRFITSEYFDGQTITEYFEKYGYDKVDSVVSQICHTLFFLHESNLIYFDLKPENILVKDNNFNPQIKFIDFGFVQNTRKIADNMQKGTPHYIAPEILQNKDIDFRADLYSLGIMLFKIFSGKFPFNGQTDLEIYKGHIEEEINFTRSRIPKKYLPVVKKLCAKDPAERYNNALEVLIGLGLQTDCELLRRWEPVRTFVINNAVVDLKNYLLLNEPDFIKLIRGVSLSGKTSLVEEIAYNFDAVVLISPSDFQTNISQWKSFLYKILFSEAIYNNIGTFLINRILKIIQEEPANLADELKSIFINLSERVKFTIIFDDFNRYDPLTIQLLMQILPIFMVNKIRTVVIENEDYPESGEFSSQPIMRKLEAFTEEQVHSLLFKTFKNDFPYEKVSKIIYQNCDLYPGAIITFIKDLIFSKAIQFSEKGIIDDNLVAKAELLKENQYIFYESRLQELTEPAKDLLRFLSLFEADLTLNQIQSIYEIKYEVLNKNIVLLTDLKILVEENNRAIHFSSAGLKNYIYKHIPDITSAHLDTANRISRSGMNIPKLELARQYLLGADLNSTFNVTLSYVDEITKYETYNYQLEILKKLNEIELTPEQEKELMLRLSEVYYHLGNLKSAFEIIPDLLQEDLPDSAVRNKLTLRMGECLVGLGNIGEGLKIYEELYPKITDNNERLEVAYEIASAQSYAGAINEAEEGLNSILKDTSITPELKARCLNLLGIIEAHYKNNVKSAIKYFNAALEIYTSEGIALKEAQVTKNIGNVYYMEGNFKEAEIFWTKSLNKNLEIGNLEEEATLLNNYGVLHFKNLDLERASENYKRALAIYKSLGRRFGEGLGYSNLGETYYFASEYDEATISLDKARILFTEIGDWSELCEVLVLKGYLLKSVNDNAGLIKLVDEYQKLVSAKNLSAKEAIHLRLLEIFAGSTDFITTNESLQAIKDDYLAYGEYSHFQKVTAILCEYLLANKKIDLAHKVITSEDFTGSIQDTPYFLAYEKFLSGKISYERKDNVMKSNLEYYEEAYNILQECSITELTWRNIASLAEAYMDRGNINKAVEYIQLTKSLLNHISMSIKDIRLRSLYLSAPERKATIEKLNIWESFIK